MSGGYTLTDFGQAVLELGDWQRAAVAACLAAKITEKSTEADVWDALEPHGLNNGIPRPEPREEPVKRSPKPRKYRPASYWQARVDRLSAELDRINQQARASANPDRASAWSAFDGGRNRKRAEADARRSDRRRIISRDLATARFRLANATARDGASNVVQG